MTLRATLVAALAILAAAAAVSLFPRAFPILSLQQSLTRDMARTRADSFFRAHALAPPGARTAVRFHGNDSLRTFVELAGGGADSLAALLRGRDVAPFTWSVRAFVPRDPREARVDFAPDGRIVGFARILAESDRRPAVTADSGRRLAELALGGWLGDPLDRWHLITASYETRKTSGRVDRTYTFERTDRRVGGAPIRSEVVIAGDAPSRVRCYVEIPESFRRRYREMRSANDILALIAALGALGIGIAGAVFLSRSARAKRVRWREASTVGAVIGILAMAAGLNEMPTSWYGYDTAMSSTAFQAIMILGAALAGLLTAVITGLTLAAAEAASRQAFPQQLDWWKLWTYRGTREVARRVGGGYAVAAIALAYVVLFYLAARTLLGWWVPSELLDDPNQIATPMPWLAGLAVASNAGVWEEALFRALPLSLWSLWVGQRPRRGWWMAAGIVVSALIFGFAHASYPSWPPYSRGIEIFLDACFWGVLVVTVGALVTVIAHFLYDLVLFGLFATSNSAAEYRISAFIVGLALLAPALAVAWRWLRQRGLTTAPLDARFVAWSPLVPVAAPATSAPRATRALTARARSIATMAMVVGAIMAVALPPPPSLGPAYTADRARAIATADSVLRARGGDPASWRRLTGIGNDTLTAWPHFLRTYGILSEAQRFATTYHAPTWWTVRYVRTDGTAEQRAEEWRVRILPDGRALDARHLIPDSATRRSATPDEVRRIALVALTRDGMRTATLQEFEYKETARPTRHDVTVTYTDTAIRLPAGAAARAWVSVAGDEPLVARRGVELPESFLRDYRDRQTTRAVIAALCALVLIVGVVTGAIVVTRRREMLVRDGMLDRRRTSTLVAALVSLALVGGVNALPSALFDYDTSQPWSRFLGATALGLVSAIPLSLVVLGLWLALGALRRRVGIPMLMDSGSSTARRDMVLAGLGLGSLVYALSRIRDVVTTNDLPHAPSTLLNQAIPMIAGVAAVPATSIMLVAVVAIPLLVIVGITAKRATRALIGAAMAALLVTALLAMAADANPFRSAALVAMLAVAAFGVSLWGTVSAWSWVVAALSLQGLGGLHQAIHGPTWQERAAHGLVAGFAYVLVALIARHARSDDVVR